MPDTHAHGGKGFEPALAALTETFDGKLRMRLLPPSSDVMRRFSWLYSTT